MTYKSHEIVLCVERRDRFRLNKSGDPMPPDTESDKADDVSIFYEALKDGKVVASGASVEAVKWQLNNIEKALATKPQSGKEKK